MKSSCVELAVCRLFPSCKGHASASCPASLPAQHHTCLQTNHPPLPSHVPPACASDAGPAPRLRCLLALCH